MNNWPENVYPILVNYLQHLRILFNNNKKIEFSIIKKCFKIQYMIDILGYIYKTISII